MISIIVPIYNTEKYLRQCIDSILAQTYRDFEILLINDGSTDKSGEICEEYAKNDGRIRVFHTENKGLSSARNLGLCEAKGDYIGFVDSDDWIEPDMYEALLRKLVETGADISACEIWRDHQACQQVGGMVQNAVYADIDAIKALIHYKLYNNIWSKLYKKDLWANIRFPDGHVYEDVATLFKVVLKSHIVSSTSKPLYHYRLRKDGIAHSPQTQKKLVDAWMAHYNRYNTLIDLPEIKKDRECMDKMENWLAVLACRIWGLMYEIPREQRDYKSLRSISVFMQNHTTLLLGNNNSGLLFRIKTYFCRYANDFSFASLFILSKCYHFIKPHYVAS